MQSTYQPSQLHLFLGRKSDCDHDWITTATCGVRVLPSYDDEPESEFHGRILSAKLAQNLPAKMKTGA